MGQCANSVMRECINMYLIYHLKSWREMEILALKLLTINIYLVSFAYCLLTFFLFILKYCILQASF